MPERQLDDFVPRYDTFDLEQFEVPCGIAISGMSQAGKSTLGRSIQSSLELLVPGIHVLAFPNSNGFRGVARRIITQAGLDDNAVISPTMADDLVGKYLDEYSDVDLLVRFYENPEERMRVNAVNKLVAHVGDHPKLNPLINQASTQYLYSLINEPGYAKKLGMKRPHMVLMDGRNADGEGYDKFKSANMINAVNFIVTCDEAVAINRIPRTGSEPNEVRIENLRNRNNRDRDREINRTSMPEDYSDAIAIEKALRAHHRTALRSAGMSAAANPEEVPLTIATDRLHPDRIGDGAIYVLSGVLQAVKTVKYSDLVTV